jgi:hypothetical protein
VGTVEAALTTSDAKMVFVCVTPIARTRTVVLMVVEEPAELVSAMMQFVEVQISQEFATRLVLVVEMESATKLRILPTQGHGSMELSIVLWIVAQFPEPFLWQLDKRINLTTFKLICLMLILIPSMTVNWLAGPSRLFSLTTKEVSQSGKLHFQVGKLVAKRPECTSVSVVPQMTEPLVIPSLSWIYGGILL